MEAANLNNWCWIHIINSSAKLPTKGDSGSVGYDLYSPISGEVQPGEYLKVPLGFCMSFTAGKYARIAPRSGLALRNGIDVLAGVVDPSYRGEVCVIVINHGKETFSFGKGDRIAQMIFELAANVTIVGVASEEELGTSDRGKGGFGSTGK